MTVSREIKKSLSDYKHTSLFWTDLLFLVASKPQSLMSVCPFRKMASNAKKISSETIEMNEELVEFNSRLSAYYKQLSDTWSQAQEEYGRKVPEIPNDSEHLESSKRIWIDIFENYFTRLFDSPEFAENFGKMVTSELELMNRWNNIASIILENSNMPTKKEMDEVYKELHSLRKRIAKLEKIANREDS